MFGHQNDVISQDQRADASVPLPEDTINALTQTPPIGSQTDNHDPVTTAPQPDLSNPQPTVLVPTPAQPPQPPAQSLDGVITSQQSSSSTSFPAFTSPASYSQSDAPASDSNSIPTEQPSFSSEPSGFPAHETTPYNISTQTEVADESSQDAIQAEQEISATATAQPIQHVKVTPHPDELLKIKQEALTSLSPLVGQLDVSPEEKFRTVMMLIQASDDPAHLSEAYELAQTITSEKARAQALLDIVNEINYFTQKDKTT